MRKILLVFILAASALITKAQMTPAITLSVDVDGNTRTLTFSSTTVSNKLQIDWGDGNLITTDTIALHDVYGTTTSVEGTPVGTGVIKVYGTGIAGIECTSKMTGPKLNSIDLTNDVDLETLNLSTNNLSTIDLSKNVKLSSLTIINNKLTSLDVKANTALTHLIGSNNAIKKIDLSANTELNTLNLSTNGLTAIDLSNNLKLKNIYLLNNELTNDSLKIGNNVTDGLFLSLNNNKLTSFDATELKGLKSGKLYLVNNQLTEIKIDTTAYLSMSKNNFTLATLPAFPVKLVPKYYYAPQNAFVVNKEFYVDKDTLDLSSLSKITGFAASAQTTTYKIMTKNGTALTAGTDYAEKDGKFVFLKAQSDSVYVAMTTKAFTLFSGSNAYKTTLMKVCDADIVLNVDVDGSTRVLSFLSSSNSNKLNIDWGDGKLVQTDTIAVDDGVYHTMTDVSGIPVNQGIIKIYGHDIIGFESTSTMKGPKINTVDLQDVPYLQFLGLSSNNISAIDVSKNYCLKQLDMINNKLTSINVKNDTLLERINVSNNMIESIDLSANPKLIYLNIGTNKLTAIDLSNNLSLQSIYLLNNQITSAIIGNNTTPKLYLSMNNNLLTSFDATALTGLSTGSLFISGNKLTSLSVGTVKTLIISNNEFSLATLPAFKTVTTYNYAPQKAMAIQDIIRANVEVLDLSAQTNIIGLSTSAQPTVFTWKTTGGTTLVAGTDYTEDNGKFTFLKSQSDSVYATMTTAAFPKFTGTNAFKTTLMKVDVATGINELAGGVKVRAYNGQLSISGMKANDKVTIYNVIGETITNQVVNSSEADYTLSKGIYLVKVNERVTKVSLK